MARTAATCTFFVAAVFLVGCDRPATRKNQPAGSELGQAASIATPGGRTPVAALRSFYTALAEGDADRAASLTVSPDSNAQWIDVQVKLNKAFRNLGRAGTARFGDEGKVLHAPPPAEVILRKLDSIQPVEKGQTAEWPINPRAPLQLTKTQSGWKIDLAASFGAAELVAQQIAVFATIAAYVDDIAAGIDNDRYSTVAEVQKELKRRREAMESGKVE